VTPLDVEETTRSFGAEDESVRISPAPKGFVLVTKLSMM